MNQPRHPQIMNPAADPEEFIASSVYWYPLIFPTRTEVLDHTFLCGANGYEWNEQGQICSVFAAIGPDRLDSYEKEAQEAEAEGDEWLAAYCREERRVLQAIRDDYLRLARTYGPVRTTISYPGGPQQRTVTSRDLPWTLLGRAPGHVDAAWVPVLAEVRALFAPILIEQGQLW